LRTRSYQDVGPAIEKERRERVEQQAPQAA